MVVRRLRLYPDAETTATLKRWFGDVRFTYNAALARLRSHPKTPKNFFWLRNRFVNACNIPASRQHLLRTPKHVREGALKELVAAFKANFTKLRNGTQQRFNIKFRSRKAGEQSIIIPKTAVKLLDDKGELKMYPTYLTGLLKYRSMHLNAPQGCCSPPCDCRLTLSRTGQFHICIPCVAGSAFARENQAGKALKRQPTERMVTVHRTKDGHWVAIDPGVRTFVTVYGPDGVMFKVGVEDIGRVVRLCAHLDRLVSRRDAARGKRRARMSLALVRARERIRALVSEVHRKIAHWLCSNFEHIILPKFEVSNMVNRKTRKIRSDTVRAMLTWGHYRFQQWLLHKASIEGCKVYICSEAYTSKTCTRCGTIKGNLGGAKTFRCDCCGLRVDRDAAGARNIFLRTMTHHLHHQQAPS